MHVYNPIMRCCPECGRLIPVQPTNETQAINQRLARLTTNRPMATDDVARARRALSQAESELESIDDEMVRLYQQKYRVVREEVERRRREELKAKTDKIQAGDYVKARFKHIDEVEPKGIAHVYAERNDDGSFQTSMKILDWVLISNDGKPGPELLDILEHEKTESSQ